MIYVGVDTGVNTGFAIWDKSQKTLTEVLTLKIHQAMDRIRELTAIYPKEKIFVRVEDARQRTWFGTERMPREEERKKLQGVGSVKRDATIWEDFLSELGVNFEMVAPKRNVTKLDQETFKNYTKWSKRTSEHARDAVMLVYGF
jgi:hypothetical protein